MDMKRILQALDGAAEKPKVADSDMKRFVSIISESARPSNRLTQAESIAVNHYSAPPKKDITSPVLNISKDAKPSMIGKYFKTVSEEFEESTIRSKERSKQLAEIVSKKINETTLKDKEDLKAKRKALQDIQLDPNTSKDPELTKELVRRKANLEKEAKKKGLSEDNEDPVDTVTVDIPLLMRLLEYAKEDAETDMDLHHVTEKLISLSKDVNVLTMDQYDAIVGDQLALPAPDENKDGKEDY
jgi:hypothetical protein